MFKTEMGSLYNTNFLELDVEDETVDLIVTDVPYGVGYKNKKWDNPDVVFGAYLQWLSKMYGVLKDGGHCYIFVPTLEIDEWVKGIRDVGFVYKNLLSVSVFPSQHHRFSNNFIYDNQLIIFAHKGKGRDLNQIEWVKTSDSWLKDKRNPNPKKWSLKYPAFIRRELGRGNIKANAQTKMLHPNQKSHDLIGKFIELSSEPGEVVADFFCGSGTTLVEAQRLGRRWIGCDFDKGIYDVAVRRLNDTL